MRNCPFVEKPKLIIKSETWISILFVIRNFVEITVVNVK